MEITGAIEKILTLESGTTKDGKEWQKQSFIVANNEGYDNKKQIFCFEIFGEEKVANFYKYNKVGDVVKVDFNISTNEWKERYFTSLQAWKVFKAEQTSAIPEKENNYKTQEDEHDNLPF